MAPGQRPQLGPEAEEGDLPWEGCPLSPQVFSLGTLRARWGLRLAAGPIGPWRTHRGPPVSAAPHLWGASQASGPLSWLPGLLPACPGPPQPPPAPLELGGGAWQPGASLAQPQLPSCCGPTPAARPLLVSPSSGPAPILPGPSSGGLGAGWGLRGLPQACPGRRSQGLVELDLQKEPMRAGVAGIPAPLGQHFPPEWGSAAAGPPPSFARCPGLTSPFSFFPQELSAFCHRPPRPPSVGGSLVPALLSPGPSRSGGPRAGEGEQRELHVMSGPGRPACLSELLGPLQSPGDKAQIGLWLELHRPWGQELGLLLCLPVPCGFFLAREGWGQPLRR